MKEWKKALAITMASVTIGGFGAAAEAAGYELNSEVKTATPALQQAAQIGVLKYTNPDEEMQANIASEFGMNLPQGMAGI